MIFPYCPGQTSTDRTDKSGNESPHVAISCHPASEISGATASTEIWTLTRTKFPSQMGLLDYCLGLIVVDDGTLAVRFVHSMAQVCK